MEKELTVISIFHDLNLAGLYCDRLLLLEKGTININHRTSEVLKEERIRAVYKADIKNQPHPMVPVPQMVLLPTWNNTVVTDSQEINPGLLTFTANHIVLQSPIPLRTMSSGVIGSGVGWNQIFVNRHVEKDYNCENHREEMASYLKENGFTILGTVGMMTAVMLEDVSFKMVEEEDFSILVVVTAGTGNAVDASLSDQHQLELVPGTINTWIFVNGELSEEAFIQSIMTATEAKVKAMENQKITDSITGTIATGTSTDSILIGATQKGKKLEYAGTITSLGKLISKGVYECTTEAIQNSQKRYQQ
jgi:iron complex transport system ATP-binding protein